jgi:hypothetical protein
VNTWCEVVGGRYWEEFMVSGGVRVRRYDIVVIVPIDSDVVQVEDGESMVAEWMLLTARWFQCRYDDMVLPVW